MQLKSSLWLNDRQPVKVLKSPNDRQSHILLKFKESKEPIQFKLSYVDWQLPSDPEELYRSQVQDLVYARLKERDLGFLRAVTTFKLVNHRQSEFRESSEPIMYKLSYNLSTEKF